MKPKILVILGTTRKGRRGDKVAKATMSSLSKIKGAKFELVDLRDWDFPFYDFPTYPSDKKGFFETKLQEKWAKKIYSGDGYIMIAPEYNHGYSAVLKNAIDYLWYEWNHKPATFISYGSMSGGLRAVEQLRQVVIEVEMIPIRESVSIPYIRKQLSDSGELIDDSFDRRVAKLAERLILWAKSLKKIRKDLSY